MNFFGKRPDANLQYAFQRHNFWQELLIVFLPSGLLLFALIAFWHYSEYRRELRFMQSMEVTRIETGIDSIQREFQVITSDLLVLAEGPSLQRFLESGLQADRQELEAEFLNFSRYKRKYDQIRFLDRQGQEIVRINWNNGQPAAVPADELQNKGQRYYFQDTYRLGAGEVFVSPLDLNIEGGSIELPFKPMIRFGTPVYPPREGKLGIVLLNYHANILLQQLETAMASDGSQPMLLNSDGYWLMAPNSDDEWGFMLGNEQRTFRQVYPHVWELMSQQEQGQITVDEGIFTFTTIYPLTVSMSSSTGAAAPFAPSQMALHRDNYFWKVVSWVPMENLRTLQRRHVNHTLIQTAIIGGVLVSISSLVAKGRLAHRQTILQLKASEQRLRTITNEVAEGLLVVDPEDNVMLVNPEAERLLGFTEADMLGHHFHSLIYRAADGTPIDQENCAICPEPCAIVTTLQAGQTVRISQDEFTRADGSTMAVAYNASPLWEAGRVAGAVVVFRDITQEVEAQQKLSHMALRDALTGLFNRRELERVIQNTMVRARETKFSFALLILDIDHFKQVNDTYGHLVGDQS
jgi:PAS domain-containing protein